MKEPSIKWGSLLDKLGVSQKEIAELRQKRAINAVSRLNWYGTIVARGGNIHGSDPKATATRRAANKRARAARRVGRVRG